MTGVNEAACEPTPTIDVLDNTDKNCEQVNSYRLIGIVDNQKNFSLTDVSFKSLFQSIEQSELKEFLNP